MADEEEQAVNAFPCGGATALGQRRRRIMASVEYLGVPTNGYTL